MKKLKKLTCFLLMGLFWSLFCGFQNVNYGVINQNSSGYTEFITINFNSEDFINRGIDYATFIQNVDNWKADFENVIKQNIENKINHNINDEIQRNELLNSIQIKSEVGSDTYILNLVYEDFNALCFMCDISNENINKSTKNSFLTYDVITTMPVLASKIANEFIFEKVVNLFKQKIVLNYGIQNANILQNYNLSFSYLSTYHRLHSDADLVLQNDNYYQHTWKNLNPNTDTFTIYYTVSNKIVWYVLALILGGGFAVGYLIFKKNK